MTFLTSYNLLRGMQLPLLGLLTVVMITMVMVTMVMGILIVTGVVMSTVVVTAMVVPSVIMSVVAVVMTTQGQLPVNPQRVLAAVEPVGFVMVVLHA